MVAHPSPESTRLLTVAEAAEIKSVHPRTVRGWITRGILPAERTGPRLIRIRRHDLDHMGEVIGADKVAV